MDVATFHTLARFYFGPQRGVMRSTDEWREVRRALRRARLEGAS